MVEVRYQVPAGVAAQLARIEGVEAVLAGIVGYLDRHLGDADVLALLDQLTRRLDLPGYQAVQHGRGIFSRPDEGE